ncbi:immune inhibitor A [Bacillus sp. ISL-35]|uniref:immune inhibitor A domain-containing protein n=1 Tax=Bacillus sp. ISL-35 TaxID=2819122 RepID=UPI001BE643A5|nr:immune inhibitor A domain-containing protein [Bacillus sp. ISL-35]MBT2679628.1 immune inhibitor A [Bacillus sp. ISL-35]
MTAMLASTLSFASAGPATVKAVEKPSYQANGGAPIDLGIANDERLIEMLKKQGKISKDATPAEAEKGLQKYLNARAKSGLKVRDGLPKPIDNVKDGSKDSKTTSLKNGKGNKLGQAKKNAVDGVEKEPYNDEVRKDNVLVLKIDFPDYPRNSIKENETDFYYDNYTDEHYQNMIFGENGYKGPNGEDFVSMKQYYEQQSGDSYTVEGNVAGWYTAAQPAAFYGHNDPAPDGNDYFPQMLVYEALSQAAQDPNVDLSEYDQWDRDDYDDDGIYAEPDGIIDHLMVIHAGVGEEAGGGALGADAIWSHRSKLGSGPIGVPGGLSDSDRWGGVLAAWDYTIEPEDGAAGVFIHEYGHDLGLPDEYDTIYSGTGEAVAYWSVMASGSWAGKIGGTEPPGFSPYAKEKLQQWHGGNWLSGTTLNSNDITSEGTTILLDEGVTKGTNNDAVRIDLPDKENTVNTPASGKYEYFSGSGNLLDNSMVATVDLTNATNATLNFKAWYDIETEWDYASVKVNGESVAGNITTADDPNDQNPGNGITGSSNGDWVDAEFDLSAYVGEKVTVEFNYWTDPYVANPGFYVDDITVSVDGNQVLTDDAEGDSKFTLDGFKKDIGKFYSKNYYLLEWRSHNGVDEGLKNIRRGDSIMTYDQGLVVWYVDETYDNNWTGVHPGEGFLGVVDADQHTNYWSDKAAGSTRYQLHDAAFGLEKSEKMFLDYSNYPTVAATMKDNFTKRNPLFDDSADYSNVGMVDAGRNVPKQGLKFRVVGQSADGTVGKVLIFK